MEELERRKLSIQLRTDIRAKGIVQHARHSTRERLRDVGSCAIFANCESGSDCVLHLMTKNATAQHTIDGCRLLPAAAIVQLTNSIHDLPGETDRDTELPLSHVTDLARHPHNQQKHHLFTPFPATDMYEAPFGNSQDGGRA